MKIIVNARERETDSTSLGYKDVIEIAGYDRHRIVSVTYRWRGDGDVSRSGILSPGQYVTPAEGMVFNVADTSRA